MACSIRWLLLLQQVLSAATSHHEVIPAKDDAMATADDPLLSYLARKADDLEQKVIAQDKFLSFRFAEFIMLMDGNWSEYGQWLPCSRKCNGQSFRFRHCNNPLPSNGGKDCVGPSTEMMPCSTQCLTSEAEVRLVGGSRASEGRLEVFEADQWGTICDRNFSYSDAIVACKMLGYQQTPVVLGAAYHGEGKGPIYYFDLMCMGTEKDIFHCPGALMADVNMECRHDNDVSIDCEPMKPRTARIDSALKVIAARLSGGSRPTKGRLEVQVNNSTWGTVCDDHFDTKDAIVACRMLNMIKGFEPVLVKDYNSTGQTGPVLLDDLHCSGVEYDLDLCKHRPVGHHSCHHYEDVGIDCQPGLSESIQAQCPPDFMEHKGFCYFFSEEKLSMENATKKCQELDGHLLEIRDFEENTYVNQLIMTKTVESLWLGLKKDERGDYIFDTDRRKPVYNKGTLPDIQDPEKECVKVTEDKQWLEEKCDMLLNYVCQKHGKIRARDYLP
ncbi:hypothetical protein V1264_014924 [Littorina saxatilis]|uniref:Uncharacterized protein n=1 Tax=Littorina saxatilis TaxID=31220 RepID=A0AAN9BNZ1_9CAEN